MGTFNSLNGKSAIDHVLINDTLLEKFLGMHIDEDRMLLDISDHCLTRIWFKVKNYNEKTDWKKTNSKTINWVSKDEKSLKKFEVAFEPQTGKKISFRKMYEQDETHPKLYHEKKKGSKLVVKAKTWYWLQHGLIRS